MPQYNRRQMATIREIERQIGNSEGLRVRIERASPGRRGAIPDYEGQYQRKARNSFSVTQWRDVRFAKLYPGLAVSVLDGNGKIVSGRTKLAKLRADGD